MGEREKERKRLAGLSDKALAKHLLSDEPYLLDAFRERDYRTNKKLVQLSRNLLKYTIALFILTLALLFVEIRGVFFPKVIGQPDNQFQLEKQGNNQQNDNHQIKR